MAVTITITVLSQVASVFRPIMYVLWVVVAIICAFGCRLALSHFTLSFIFLYIVYIVYCVLLTFLTETNYLKGSYFSLLAIPLLVLIIADLLRQKLDSKHFIALCYIYFISSVVFAVWVNVKYFPTLDIFYNSLTYVFDEKNSASQIWTSASIVAFFILKPKFKVIRALKYVLISYLIFMVFLSQCRAAIFAITVVFIFYLIFYSRHKIATICIALVVISLFLAFDRTRGFLIQSVNLNKYDLTDIDQFSSGRLRLWNDAIDIFIQSPLFGCGKYYVDNSYIMILTESGIIGFLIIETIWFYRIILNIKYSSRYKYGLILPILTIFYFIESLFEGNPPFGPGVSSFIFWFFCGYMEALSISSKKQHSIEKNRFFGLVQQYQNSRTHD